MIRTRRKFNHLLIKQFTSINHLLALLYWKTADMHTPSISTLFLLKTSRHEHPLLVKISRYEHPLLLKTLEFMCTTFDIVQWTTTTCQLVNRKQTRIAPKQWLCCRFISHFLSPVFYLLFSIISITHLSFSMSHVVASVFYIFFNHFPPSIFYLSFSTHRPLLVFPPNSKILQKLPPISIC